MVIPQERLRRAVDALVQFGAKRVLLFGSYLETPEEARDIDLAVDGIPLNRLIKADVAVHDILQVPTDLVSREENPRFFEIVERRGKVIFEKS